MTYNLNIWDKILMKLERLLCVFGRHDWYDYVHLLDTDGEYVVVWSCAHCGKKDIN